jgi:hypothetical protein
LFSLLLAGCIGSRAPAWQRADEIAHDPPADVLVKQAQDALARGRNQSGVAGLKALDQAASLAERALVQRNQLFRDKVKRKEQASWLFTAPERADLPALVIYADALLAWADRHSTSTLLEQQDNIREAAERAWKLDRSFGYGAPDRILGTLLATLPVGSGNDWIRSMEYFEAARAESHGYLPTLVLYAERWADPVGDHRLYTELLDEVLRADPRALPEAETENRAAQARARLLRAER